MLSALKLCITFDPLSDSKMKLDIDTGSNPTNVNQYHHHVNTNHGVLDLIRPRRAIYGKHHESAPKVTSKPRPTVFDRMVMFEMAASSSDLDDLIEKLQVIIMLIKCNKIYRLAVCHCRFNTIESI